MNNMLRKFLLVVFLAMIAFSASGAQQAKYRHSGPAVLPDPKATPGEARTNDIKEVCEGGSTKQFRHTTETMKAKVYAKYGIDKHKLYPEIFCINGAVCDKDPKPPFYEMDHSDSLELGGADTESNLSPQPYYAHPGAHEKDELENWLRKQVCVDKTMSLKKAQTAISKDWYAAYKEMKRRKER